MNTFIYLKSKSALAELNKTKSRKFHGLALVPLLFIGLALTSNSVLASMHENSTNNTNYSHEILVNTQKALNQMDDNPKDALTYVTQSLDLIKKIESNFNDNTSLEIDRNDSDSNNVTYTHYLPKLNMDELNNSETLSALNYKLVPIFCILVTIVPIKLHLMLGLTIHSLKQV